jgi:hypothetical protein
MEPSRVRDLWLQTGLRRAIEKPGHSESMLASEHRGNLQVSRADGDMRVQAYIAALPGRKRDIGRRLDSLIVAAVPNVRDAQDCREADLRRDRRSRC